MELAEQPVEGIALGQGRCALTGHRLPAATTGTGPGLEDGHRHQETHHDRSRRHHRRGRQPQAELIKLIRVRAFYLDIAHWAAEERVRWAPWVVHCLISDEEISNAKDGKSFCPRPSPTLR